MVQRREDLRPECKDGAVGIREPHAPRAIDDKIRRMVMYLTVQSRRGCARSSIRQKLNDATAAILTSEQPAVGGKCDAVNAIRILAVFADSARARIKTPYKAFVDHAEQHQLAVPCESAHAALVGSGDSFEVPAHLFSLPDRNARHFHARAVNRIKRGYIE